MSGFFWRVVGATVLAGCFVTGCGTQARWVNCAGRLEPINLPAPKQADEPAAPEPAQVEQTAP